MHSISGEQQERIRRFDLFRRAAETALTNKEIAEWLGPVALELLTINERAFVPDVRRGIASLPPGYGDTHRLPVLPKLPTDGVLQPSHTLLLPTKINIGYASAAIPAGRPLEPVEIAEAFRAADTGLRNRHVNPKVPQVHSLPATVRGAPILGRPLLALPPHEAGKPLLVQQVNAVHELMHGKDHLYRLADVQLLTSAYAQTWLELRGHIAGAAPMVAAYEQGKIDSDYIWEHFGDTATVLNGTRDLQLHPHTILSDDFACHEQNKPLDEMAWTMLAHGIVNVPGAE